MTLLRLLRLGAVLAWSAAATCAWSAEPAAPPEAARAQALLDRAVARYQADGEPALAAFSRAGEFVEGDLYVYVVGTDGVMYASGGPSLALVGRNVRDLRDAEGRAFMREILDGAAATGSGSVEYRWLNRQHNKVERKVAYYRAVGDRVLVAGYYVPRATVEQAKAMLWRAVHELKTHGDKAFEAFNDLNGGFVQDDLYVYVVGIDDRRMHAHGATPRLVGQDVAGLQDAAGKPLIKPMLELARSRSEGEYDYLWRNPVTQKNEPKRAFFVRVGNYLVAVGAFRP